jgi:ribosomal protein S20
MKSAFFHLHYLALLTAYFSFAWNCSNRRLGRFHCRKLKRQSMMAPPMNQVTRILSAIEQGDAQASEQLLPLVYDELRKQAAQRLAHENWGRRYRPQHSSMMPTADWQMWKKSNTGTVRENSLPRRLKQCTRSWRTTPGESEHPLH